MLVEADGIGRYPQELETAVYFCTLEALQNAAKYAQANEVAVSLLEDHGELVLSIHDDGRGSTAPRHRSAAASRT